MRSRNQCKREHLQRSREGAVLTKEVYLHSRWPGPLLKTSDECKLLSVLHCVKGYHQLEIGVSEIDGTDWMNAVNGVNGLSGSRPLLTTALTTIKKALFLCVDSMYLFLFRLASTIDQTTMTIRLVLL